MASGAIQNIISQGRKMRIEHDALGELEIDDNVYWGIHTQRALYNFEISNYLNQFSMIKALAIVKKSCAEANYDLNFIDETKYLAICASCDEIIDGKHISQFPIDAMQGGAGTSLNMNMNEVIANLALEKIGKEKGQYSFIHPIEHVNLHQSTNDVYPSALKIALIFLYRELSQSIAGLQGALNDKEKEFADILTIGRTELQDAVPMTLGAQFGSFAEAIARDRWRSFKCEERLRILNIGGTAIGTGLTAPRKYIFLIIEKLRKNTGLGLSRAENMIDATANNDAFSEVSGILNAHAANLIKISSDLRLLHYLDEIHLPSLQAGSSIMPGKVNPVIIESIMGTALKVLSNDKLINDLISRGTLQINEFMPLIAYTLIESLELLIKLNNSFAKHIIQIKANKEQCLNKFYSNPIIITAFIPIIGYDKCSDIISDYTKISEPKPKFDSFLENYLDTDTIKKVLNPSNLMSLGYK